MCAYCALNSRCCLRKEKNKTSAAAQQSISVMGVAITMPETGARPLSRIIMGISNRPFRRIARKKGFMPFPVAWKKEMMA